MSKFHIADHALIAQRLAELRDKTTISPRFRQLSRELGVLMGSEMVRNWETVEVQTETPCGVANGRCLTRPVILIPILRAGLVYAEGVSQILPEASMGHIGLYRDEVTHRPVSYLTKLPHLEDAEVVVIDPMLATGYSAIKAIETVIAHGAKPEYLTLLTIVAAPEGRQVVENLFPSITIWTATLDDHLNENAYIVPGLGDAGDRIFGTL